MSESSGPVTGASTGRPAGSPSTRRGGLRWGVALVVVAVVVGGLGTLGTLVSTPTPPDAITYVPAGSVAVLEVRPDLPGDQRDSLGAMLLRIPGFADVAALNDRVNAALDDVVRRATDGSRTWTTDVRPYAAGAVLLAALPATDAAAGGQPRMLAVLTTDGNPGCEPLEAGRQVTIERYRDADIRSAAATAAPSAAPATRPSGTASTVMAGQAPACAVSGRFVLLGEPAAIRAALDAKAQGRSVAGDNGYGAAFRALPEAHAAWGYLNARAAMDLAAALPLPSGLPIPSMARPSAATAVTAALPEWAAMQVRFTASGAVIDAVMPDRRAAMLAALPAPTGGAGPAQSPAAPAASTIAASLPATTVALLEAHDVGAMLQSLASASAVGAAGATGATPFSSLAPSLEGAAGALQAVPLLVDPSAQAGAVLVASGDTVSAGLVLQVKDGATVRAALDQLRLLGGLLGGVTSTDHHGTPILSVPVASMTALAAGMAGGAGSGLPGLPGLPGLGGASASPRPAASQRPSASPAAATGLPSLTGDLSLSIAVHGNLLVVGLGDGLPKAVIDTPAGASLADQAGYRTALTAAGTPNLGSLYLDVAAMRAAGARSGPTASAAPRASANPFLEAAGTVAGSVTSADGLLRGRLVLTVR